MGSIRSRQGRLPENAVISEDNGTITFYSKDGVRVSKTEYDAAVNMLKNEYNLTATVENGKTYYYYEDSLGKHSFEAGKAPENAAISEDNGTITFYSKDGVRVSKTEYDAAVSMLKNDYKLNAEVKDGKTYYYYEDSLGKHSFEAGKAPENAVISEDNGTITFYSKDGVRVSKTEYDAAVNMLKNEYNLTATVENGKTYYYYEDSLGKHSFEAGKAPENAVISEDNGTITFYSKDGVRVSKTEYDAAVNMLKNEYNLNAAVKNGKTYYYYEDSLGKHSFEAGKAPENAVISEDNGTITFYSKDGVRVSKTEYDAAVNMLKNEYNLTATVENGEDLLLLRGQPWEAFVRGREGS